MSSVKDFIINHWVSWLIEILILSAVAYFTISETRKTAEQTRAMLAKYDAAISQYAADKSKVIDQSVKSGFDSAKEKAKKVTVDDIKSLLKSSSDPQQ